MRKLLFVAFCCWCLNQQRWLRRLIRSALRAPKRATNSTWATGRITVMYYQGICMATSQQHRRKSGAIRIPGAPEESSQIRAIRHDMDNGDMAYYSYEGIRSTDITKPVTNQ